MIPYASGSNQRRGFLAVLMVFTFSFATSRPAGSAQTSLTIKSEYGDPVGAGYNYSYTTAQGTFTAQRNARNGVTVTFTGYSGVTWSMQFAAPDNQPLTPGVWLDAVTFSSNDLAHAGIQVYGLGRSCAQVTGTIQIKQVTYSSTGSVIAFWAVFSQQCEGTSAVLSGDVRYRADLPVYVTAPPRSSTERGGEIYFDVLGASALSAVTLSAAGLPDGAGFWDNGNGTAGFDWFTAPAQVGRHIVTFYATNAGGAVDSAVSIMDVTGITGFRAESDSTDYVGQGMNWNLSTADAAFSAAEQNGQVAVTIQTAGGSQWNLTFEGANGAPLAIGSYLNAGLAGSASGRPGLMVTLDGRACPDVSGQFEIKEIARDANGLVSFRALFEQHCGTASAALCGEIRWNAALPIDITAPLAMTVNAGDAVLFFVTAADPWYNPLALSAAGMPAGATFTDMGDNSGLFQWTPTAAQGGSYHVTFTADDPNGNGRETATTLIAVRSSALPPVPEAGGPYSGTVGDTLIFDGSGSTSPDGRPLTITWSFGDGTSATGVTAAHVYPAAGTYTVMLTACTDVFCASDSAAAVIAAIVPPPPPPPLPLATRAFTAAGTNPLRLDANRPQYSLYFEPVNASWTLDQVDPASVTLVSAGTGTVDRIAATSLQPSNGADRDKNGVPDLEAVFSMADMRRLLGNVPNRGQVTLTLGARLLSGAAIGADVSIQVNTNGGTRKLSVTADVAAQIHFTLAEAGFVRVRLYDLSGRMIGTLLEQDLPAGDHAVAAGRGSAGGGLPQGVYFFNVETPHGSAGGRVLLLR